MRERRSRTTLTLHSASKTRVNALRAGYRHRVQSWSTDLLLLLSMSATHAHCSIDKFYCNINERATGSYSPLIPAALMIGHHFAASAR
jgi:hypothetical protein